MVAAREVAKQQLTQANWLALNLLDVTLTTAFKDYLVHEQGDQDSDADLRAILSAGDLKGLRARIPLGSDVWAQADNFRARQRDLLYGRATPTISAAELKKVEALVEGILKSLFEIEAVV